MGALWEPRSPVTQGNGAFCASTTVEIKGENADCVTWKPELAKKLDSSISTLEMLIKSKQILY